MSEKPILMSAPMVISLLEDRKPVTRRVMKEHSNANKFIFVENREMLPCGAYTGWVAVLNGCPLLMPVNPSFLPGDVAWVREAWRTVVEYDRFKPSELITAEGDEPGTGIDTVPIRYEAGGIRTNEYDWDGGEYGGPWGRYRHARFMCRWMSRIDLQILSVRPERVQEITEEEAIKEGVTGDEALVGQIINPYRTAFADLWDKIHGPGAFERNDWVWRYEFEVVTR